MKNRILSLLLLPVLPVLVACGDDAAEEAAIEPAAPPPVAATEALPPAPEPPPPLPQASAEPPRDVAGGQSNMAAAGSQPSARPRIEIDVVTEKESRQAKTEKLAKAEKRSNGSSSAKASSSGASSDKVYIVKPGDTLLSIAREYDLNHRDIAKWNKISDPTRMQVGREIRLTPP